MEQVVTKRKQGRPRYDYPTNMLDVYKRWMNAEITAKQAQAILDLNSPTFYKMVKRFEEEFNIKLKSKQRNKGPVKIQYPSNWNEIYSKWKSKEITAKKAIELSELQYTTFYVLANRYADTLKESRVS